MLSLVNDDPDEKDAIEEHDDFDQWSMSARKRITKFGHIAI